MKRHRFAALCFVITLVGGLVSGRARAAVEQPKTAGIYVKIEGIPGGSANDKHKGEIEALQVNWSAKVKGDGGPAASTAEAAAEANDVLILKPMDAATPKLMKACLDGQLLAGVTISVHGTTPRGGAGAAAQPYDYIVYELKDVRVTAVSHAVIGSAQEQIQFRFVEMRVRFIGGDGKATEEVWKSRRPARGDTGK